MLVLGVSHDPRHGMSWGIFPLFFTSLGLGVERVGVLKAIYPAAWGGLQIITGPLSDRWGRKGLIVTGVWVQAAGLALTALTGGFAWYRFWRDSGYAIGALSAGLIADRFGFAAAILVIAAVMFSSGVIVAAVMRESTDAAPLRHG